MAVLVHPVRARQPSLEQLSPRRRSITANAIRKKQIKISDPILLTDSEPTIKYKDYSPTVPRIDQESTQHPEARSDTSHTDLKLPRSPLGYSEVPVRHESNVYVVNSEQSHSSWTDSSFSITVNPTAPLEPYKMPDSNSPLAAENHPLRQHMSGLTREPRDRLLTEVFSEPSRSTDFAQRRPSTMGSTSQHQRTETSTTRKRRSGSIRKAFGRLFSKRDKEADSPTRAKISKHARNASESGIHGSVGNLDQVYEEGRFGQSRSSPGLQGMGQDRPRRSRSPEDMLSVPKHVLPFPMNINGEQPASYTAKPTNDTMPVTPSSPNSASLHRRRATVPSIVLSPTDADTISRYWNRAPSAEPTATLDRYRTPTPVIGLAITSNTTSKRRSRSADALRDLALQQMVDGRRRSAEAQLSPWRLADQRIPEVEEGDSASPRSRHASVQNMSQLVSPAEPRPSFATESGPVPDVFNVTREGGRTSSSDQRGSYGSAKQQTEEHQPLSPVDKRLSKLELNMSQLEQSMQALSGREQSFTLQQAPRSRITSSDDHTRQARLSQMPLTPQWPPGRSVSVRHQASPRIVHARPSPSLHDIGTHFEDPTDDEEEDRRATAVPYGVSEAPLPNTQSFPTRRHTARPSTPQAQVHNFSTPYAIPKESPTRMIDQIAPIYNALQYERAVRKQLETTVTRLQHEVLNLTSVVYEMRGLGAYPTPSPDHALGLRRDQKHANDSPLELARGPADEYEEAQQQQHTLGQTTGRWPTFHASASPQNNEFAQGRNF